MMGTDPKSVLITFTEMLTNVISVTIHWKPTISFRCKPPDFSAFFDLQS